MERERERDKDGLEEGVRQGDAKRETGSGPGLEKTGTMTTTEKQANK